MAKNLIIVGAGASTDFGLPLGVGLAANIRAKLELESRNLDDPRPIFDAAMMSRLSGDYGAAMRDICGGLVAARSVDRLLDSRSDRPLVTLLGKCGIVTEIMQKEHASQIGEAAGNKWDQRQAALIHANDTWLAKLFGLLQEGVPPRDAQSIFSSVEFVTFNYDRCIEQYLRLAMQHIVNLPVEDAVQIVNKIPVIHVYGSVGNLPDASGSGGVPYGADYHFIKDASESIRTFTEGTDDGTIQKIREVVSAAQNIYFMGFGFDPKNVSLLFPNPLNLGLFLEGGQRVMGTGLGFSGPERAHFKTVIAPERTLDFAKFFPAIHCSQLVTSDTFRTRILSE